MRPYEAALLARPPSPPAAAGRVTNAAPPPGLVRRRLEGLRYPRRSPEASNVRCRLVVFGVIGGRTASLDEPSALTQEVSSGAVPRSTLRSGVGDCWKAGAWRRARAPISLR